MYWQSGSFGKIIIICGIVHVGLPFLFIVHNYVQCHRATAYQYTCTCETPAINLSYIFMSLYSLKRELEKISNEKTDIHRHYIMVYIHVNVIIIFIVFCSIMRCRMGLTLRCTSRLK